ncbi:FtsX-like permease family protein [Parashewanella curva]|uniref:FtsX-like permease family protein n=1 Tax=Parashewanella curva TaxID=2338552 RepID=A0A3L8PW44_9GAMM|nr:ABC transporter permease [Parashewanella curva]RLV58823.1 FtsX-like permease family protein [Parashewanella curva]
MFKSAIAIIEGVKAALQAIRANAMRSALTCLGIIIGVASVVTVVAVMQGFTKQINEQLSDLSPDVTSIKPYVALEDQMVGKQSKLSYDDFLYLKNKIKQIDVMTANMLSFNFANGAQYQNYIHSAQVIGTDSDYQKLYKTFPEKGRYLRESDDEKRRRVALVGETVIEKLHLPENPVGEYIKLAGKWFHIIGVGETQDSFLGFDQNNYIYIPISTMSTLDGGDRGIITIRYRLKVGADEEIVKRQITKILRQRHKISSGQPDDFQFETAKKAKERTKELTTSITGVTAGIVGISLIVGGIGVMNIMLVSVSERTRVIGTLKALGATPGFIMLQFLVEAVVLSLFGGMIGLAIGYGLSELISLMIPNLSDTHIPTWAVLLSFGFTSAIGIIFGLAPAIKAARLNPIDALRYE